MTPSAQDQPSTPGWSLAGKSAIVTGASAGIGAAVVAQLVNQGVRVAAFSRREEPLRELVRRLGSDRVLAVAGDVCAAQDRVRLVQLSREAFGPVQLLINNAGFGQKGPLELVPEAQARRQLEVNVIGPMELVRLVLPGMRESGVGRIVNVSSVAGRVAMPHQGWYSASKFALEALSDALRLEVAPMGIDVVVAEPGPVTTEFFALAEQSLEALEGDTEAYGAAIQEESLRRRVGGRWRISPEECARAIVSACRTAHPRARYPIGALTRILTFLQWLLPTALMDRVVLRASGVRSVRVRTPPVGGPGPG